MVSEAQRVAKLLAVTYGVQMAAKFVYMRQQTLTGPMGSGEVHTSGAGSLFWPAYDPISAAAIGYSLWFIADHADLLDKQSDFWVQVMNLLVAWYAAKQFPKWVKAAYRN